MRTCRSSSLASGNVLRRTGAAHARARALAQSEGPNPCSVASRDNGRSEKTAIGEKKSKTKYGSLVR